MRLYLAVDLDKIVDLFNQRGCKARWMSKKETNKLLDTQLESKPLIHQHQAILLKVGKMILYLGSQLVTKLSLDNNTPTSFVDEYNAFRSEPITKQKNGEPSNGSKPCVKFQ